MRLTTPIDRGDGGLRPSLATLKNGGRNAGHGLRSAARFLRRSLTQPAPTIRVSPLLAELATSRATRPRFAWSGTDRTSSRTIAGTAACDSSSAPA
jgi:hypothetical protein